jgi:hypothetical protein
MARTYRRDSNGRFAGSGTFKAGSRAAAKGKEARSDASLMRTLKGGEKQGGNQDVRNARSAARSRAASSGTQANLIGRAERLFKQKANQSKVKQRRMERERKSFQRRGAKRGGGQ